jgi:hypothetical protein
MKDTLHHLMPIFAPQMLNPLASQTSCCIFHNEQKAKASSDATVVSDGSGMVH